MDVTFCRTWLVRIFLLALSAFRLVASSEAQLTYEPYSFITFAGAPPGRVDGTANESRFDHPSAVAVDKAGNIYVADRSFSIRKITLDGTVSTIFGASGQPRFIDSDGSTRYFLAPEGLAVDHEGNIYATRFDLIWKITPDGVLSIFAGGTPAGELESARDGTGRAARFLSIADLAMDSAGNLYVTDGVNYPSFAGAIRKVTPDAVVTTIAGSVSSEGYVDAQGSAARFRFPEGLAVDAAGNIYVADTGNRRIRKVTPDGTVTTFAGSGFPGSGDGAASIATFDYVSGVSVDAAANVYVSDIDNSTIRKITPDGVVSTLAGSGSGSGNANGTGRDCLFYQPAGIATDGSGNVYVADMGNNIIRRITPEGVGSTVAGAAAGSGSADGSTDKVRFEGPAGVAVDNSGNLYVADRFNQTIRKIDRDGFVSTLAGRAGNEGSTDGLGTVAQFKDPQGLACDSAGTIYVADSGNHTIRKITQAGQVITIAGLAGNGGNTDGTASAARFRSPSGITVDEPGNCYVTDSGNSTIRKISPSGGVTTLAGLAGQTGSLDGSGNDARFSFPAGLAVDNAGNVYVADAFNHTIRKVTSDGLVSTLAGSAERFGHVDGSGTAAAFYLPVGVAVNSAGDIFVTAQLVRKVSSQGVVTTLAGFRFATFEDRIDGTGSAARFNSPEGIAVDSGGTLYVADTGNNTIRKSVLPPPGLANISTRLAIGTDENVLIAGFIVTGDARKKLIIRAIGPSLRSNGNPVPGSLQDPVLELRDGAGALIDSNDDWRTPPYSYLNPIPPTDNRESAIEATLKPGPYTAVVRGKDGTTGVGLVEVYDLGTESLGASTSAKLANISTRGFVQTADNVMIGGFIVLNGAQKVIVRAIGPTLTQSGVNGALQDTTLELYNGSGARIALNDDWKSDQQQEIIDTTVPPNDDRESAILRSLSPGNYTAIVRGKADTTGVALVEVYVLN